MAWIILRLGPGRDRRVYLQDALLGDLLTFHVAALSPADAFVAEVGEEVTGTSVLEEHWRKTAATVNGMTVYEREDPT